MFTLFPGIQFFDNLGNVLAGGKVYTYEAGTETPKETYADGAGGAANENPITLDSAGRALIFLSGLYDITIKTAAGVLIKTIPNVSDVQALVNETTQWTPSGLTPTYLSGTTFSLVGDQTVEFHIARRVKFICTAGTLYGTITASSYATGVTTVTVILDSGALDAGLSVVYYSFFTYNNPAIRKMPIINHGSKGGSFALNMALADVHIVEFSATATLTISSALTSDKSTIIIKNGGFVITLAGIDNNSPTLTNGASKQDFVTVVKSFGKISCIAFWDNILTS